MTHRERFHAAAACKPADRAVFDLCGCSQTLIEEVETREALERHMGFGGDKKGPYAVDERVLEAFDIDTRFVGGMPVPETIHSRMENGVSYNSFGIGSREVNGHYEICHNPLRGMSADEIAKWPMPKSSDIDRALIDKWADEAKKLYESTDYAVVATHPVLGVFELGCWMFGFDDYLFRLAAEPETIHAFSERWLSFQLDVIDMYYGAMGPYIDCTTSGDDFGMQTGPFISPAMFDEFVKPYFKTRIERTKKHTSAFYQHHTCGSVYSFIPSIIDCGVDILNPIQPGVYKMEPELLKKDFGDKIAFWGGIDTQRLLPRGTIDEIRGEVKRLLSILGQGGGYIMSPAHCIQRDVPPENIVALYEGAAEFYR